jgi:5,5'-dehydrodivanillate O-demethylase
MGPTPAPELPRWDFLVWTNGRRVWGRQPVLDCNWLQIQENSADVTHTYYLHGHMLFTLGDRSTPSMRLYRPFEGYGFQPTDLGMVKSWQYGETEQWPAAREVGNMMVFPTMVRFNTDMMWRTPADDTHTHVFAVTFERGEEVPPDEREIVRDAPSHYMADGRYDKRTIWGQDRMAWETQGEICDRSKEHLGVSDRGIIMYRQLLKEQIQRVQQGLDPLGVMREPKDVVDLPLDLYAGGSGTMRDYLDDRHEWYEVPEGSARKPGTSL